MSEVAEVSAGRRVAVDHDLCSGTGYCQRGVPAAFEVRDGQAWVREPGEWAEVPTAELREAERACPWMAIEVAEEEGGGPAEAGMGAPR